MFEIIDVSNLQERRNRRPNKEQVYFSQRQHALFEAYIAEIEEDKSAVIRRIVMREVNEHFASKEKEALKLEALRQLGGAAR